VADAFGGILKALTPQIPGIVKGIADGISGIANAISDNPQAFANFIKFVFDVVIWTLRIIEALTRVANWIEEHWHGIWRVFSNAVKDAIDQVLPAFRPLFDLVVTVIQNWAKLRHNTAVWFDRIRHGIAEQWDLMLSDAKHVWDLIYNNTIGRVIRIHQWIQHRLNELFHNIASVYDQIRHAIAHAWDVVYQNTVGRVIRIHQWIQNRLNQLFHNIASIFDQIRHAIASAWDTIWNNTVGRVSRGIQDVVRWFGTIKGRLISALGNVGSWLVQVGSNIISGLGNGIKSGVGGLIGKLKGWVVDPIVGAVKRFFGIKSPSTVMAGVGSNIIAGLIHGMLTSGANLGGLIKNIFGGWPDALAKLVEKSIVNIAKLPAKALHALGGVASKVGGFFANLFKGPVGGGVERWRGTVVQALGMLGMPIALAGRVLYQMQTESGGNPNAINLWDINAKRGDPSRGLMQVIGSTFSAYHVPGTSFNIYDPLANIAAAINYARHRYGPTLGALGSGHGYAEGTTGAAPGWAWVGERGPELVNFSGGEVVVPIVAGPGPGYAMGTDGASLAAALAKITTSTTAATYAADQAKFLKDLRLYFSPSVYRTWSNLVISQMKTMQSLETQIKTLSANVAAANEFQKQELAHLQAGTGLGAIGIQGQGSAQGVSLLTGLRHQVSVISGFGTAIRDLAKAGGSQALLKQVAGMDPSAGTTYARGMTTALKRLRSLRAPAAMVNQIVALGPDAALAYTDALAHATPAVRGQIFRAETSLAATQLAVSRGVASVVSGGAYVTGANFVAGLKSQQKHLETMFAHLGRTLGEEAIKWMRVPANRRPHGFASGGWINEPVAGYGMYTGNYYTFAERGREYVIPNGSMAGEHGGTVNNYNAHFDGLTMQAIESHVRVAFQAMAMQQGALQRNGRRS
jgi:SLT domain-containing protein